MNVSRFDQEVEPVVSLPKDAGVPTPTASQRVDVERLRTIRLAADAADRIAAANSTPKVDWAAELEPRGTQTRLGQALDDQLYRYRDAPLAGVIVISDGAQNAGIEPSAAIEAAREAGVPLYTIGVGSTEPRRNLAVRDLVVPTRAFPGDTLNIAGYLQATGYAGRSVDVELLRRRTEEAGRQRHVDRFANGFARRRWRDGAGVVRHRAGRAGHVRLSASRQRAAGRRQPARQQTRSGDGRRRPQDPRAAVRQRADARLPVPPQSAAPRPHDEDRRAAANRLKPGISQDAEQDSRPSFPARARSCTNTTASSPSIPIGRSSTPPRSSCSKSGSPKRRAA